MSYDQRCEELARVFLTDAGIFDHALERELAQAIQDTIEARLRIYETYAQRSI